MMINTDAVKAVETLDMESEVLITSPGKSVPYKMKVTDLVAAVETNKKKVYKALLTQTGTAAPTALVLENTIGDIVWARSSTGYYTGTLLGAFTSGKTVLLTGQNYSNAGKEITYINIDSEDGVYINTFDDGVSSDSVIANSVLILIEVYP